MKYTAKPLITLVLAFLGIFGCQNEKTYDEIISRECDTLLANKEIRSISIGVVKNGKIYKFHKGKLVNGKKPTDKTLYEVASLTKTFTGTLLAQAIYEKKVRLDDDIRNYLPKSFPNLEFNGHPITFRHLVTHTSGMPRIFPDTPDLFNNPDWDKLPSKINGLQAGFSKSNFFEELKKVKLDTLPGHRFGYSNAGANLLGYCIESIYSKTYGEVLNQYIFEPLKMENTKIEISNDDRKFLAIGLNPNGLKMPARAEKGMNAEGGIISTLEDMIKYMQFHLEEENPIIKISHQELLSGKYGAFENGLFWQIFKNEEKPTKIFQNGGAYGTSSWITIIPESELGIFIVTNVSGPEIHQKLANTADKIIDSFQ